MRGYNLRACNSSRPCACLCGSWCIASASSYKGNRRSERGWSDPIRPEGTDEGPGIDIRIASESFANDAGAHHGSGPERFSDAFRVACSVVEVNHCSCVETAARLQLVLVPRVSRQLSVHPDRFRVKGTQAPHAVDEDRAGFLAISRVREGVEWVWDCHPDCT